MTKCEMIITSFIIFQIMSICHVQASSKAMFHETYDHLLAIIDDIFILLKLNQNFTNTKHVTDYNTMQSFIQDAIEKTHENYALIKNISKTKLGYKSVYYISNINRMIEDMIRKQKSKTSNIYGNSKEIEHVSEDDVLKDFVNLATYFNLQLKLTSDNLKLWGSKVESQNLKTRRIFNGKSTEIRRYPFVASIHVDDVFTCAGSIIREDLIISVATCLAYYHQPHKVPVTPTIDVRVGSNSPTMFGELIPVVDMYFHPQFNKTTLRNNLLILKMSEQLDFQTGYIKSIRFDREATGLPRHVKRVLIIGWGTTDPSTNRGNLSLSHASLDTYNLEQCMNIYSRTYVTNEMFCAGFVTKGTGACQYDIGGPAIVDSTLMGISHFGPQDCGRINAPTVFIKLGYYAGWIDSILKGIPLSNETDSEQLSPDTNWESRSSRESNQAETDFQQEIRYKVDVDDILYGQIEKSDIFTPTTKQDVMTHPLLFTSIFLDPNLVKLPKFTEEEPLTEPPYSLPTPPPMVNYDKEEQKNSVVYKELLSRYFSTTTEATEVTEITETTRKDVTLNTAISTAYNAYEDFYVSTSNTTNNNTSILFTRMNRFMEDSESYENVEYEATNKHSAKKDFTTTGDVDDNNMKIVMIDSRSTRQFIVNKRDKRIQRALKRFENKFALTTISPINRGLKSALAYINSGKGFLFPGLFSLV